MQKREFQCYSLYLNHDFNVLQAQTYKQPLQKYRSIRKAIQKFSKIVVIDLTTRKCSIHAWYLSHSYPLLSMKKKAKYINYVFQETKAAYCQNLADLPYKLFTQETRRNRNVTCNRVSQCWRCSSSFFLLSST